VGNKKFWEGINMRRVVVLALLALTLPIAAWADPITLTNQFGSISVSDSGLSTVGSELTQFDNFQAAKGHSLGTVTYSTGALTSGSIAAGGTFSATGSTFDVIGRGLWAKSLDGWSHGKVTLFAGSFVDTAQYPNGIVWTLTSSKGVNLTYSLTGALQGTLYTGRQVTGTTTQNFFTTKGQLAAGIGHIRIGGTTFYTPEPGTLGLLGSGLVGIAAMFRRKTIGS
jgi:hypothetical protein